MSVLQEHNAHTQRMVAICTQAGMLCV